MALLVLGAVVLMAVSAGASGVIRPGGGGGGGGGAGGGGGTGTGGTGQGTGGAGNGLSLSVSPNAVAPSGTITVSLGIGPFTPGTTVTIYILHVLPGQSPDDLGQAVATSTGGFAATTITIPSTAPPGLYIAFAVAEGPDGPQVVTVAFVVTGTVASSVSGADIGQAVKAANLPADHPWTAPATWSSPAVQAVTTQAVDATIERSLHNADLPGTESALAAPLAGPVLGTRGGSSGGLAIPLAAGAAAVAMILGMLALSVVRRRRMGAA